jgi:hypothetical protein
VRLQLIVRLVLFLMLVASPAWSDEANQISLRGNYWRDRNTRVLAPEAALSKELPTGTLIGAHYLLDTITSASVAAGATRDQPFSEFRNEIGLTIAQRAGRALMHVGYTYSSESDYWAHTILIGTDVDLFQKNTTLSLIMTWGINDVAMRAAPTVYLPVGGLATWTTIATWTQNLSQTLLGTLEYDLSVIGFGDKIGHISGTPTASTGYQGNPYRLVNLGGSATRETVPFQRIRQTVQLTLRWLIPTGNSITPYLVFRPSYRLYWDDWGLLSHTPELRMYVPIGPVELRVTGRYYTQNEVSFGSLIEGNASYTNGQGKPCNTCISDGSRGLFYTSDPKLYAFDSFLVEGRLAISLRGLGQYRKLPLHNWLAGGIIELSYGHYFDTKFAYRSFGDADIAGLSFIFPL